MSKLTVFLRPERASLPKIICRASDSKAWVRFRKHRMVQGTIYATSDSDEIKHLQSMGYPRLKEEAVKSLNPEVVDMSLGLFPSAPSKSSAQFSRSESKS